jgi:hypothetical protein
MAVPQSGRSRAARGRLQPVAKNVAIDRLRKRLASFKSDAASNPSGRGFGVPTRAGFSERRGSVPDSDALNSRRQGTLPRSQAYRLEVSTPETSPD